MVRRHYRYFMALDEAEIATTIIALLNVFYGSIGDIRVEALMSERCSEWASNGAASMSALCQKRTLRSSALRSRWLLNARIRHRDHESSRKAYGYDEARPPAHGGTAVST
jgi:hypothetical protein